jgi:hypothetical protein
MSLKLPKTNAWEIKKADERIVENYPLGLSCTSVADRYIESLYVIKN